MIRVNYILTNLQMRNCRRFATGTILQKVKTGNDSLENQHESSRMKQFHEKLKLQPIPRIESRERFVDLLLAETDPKTGELIADNEKEPTKWGDWQNGGRVSDF